MLSLLHLLKSSGPPSALQPPGPTGTPSVLQPPGASGPQSVLKCPGLSGPPLVLPLSASVGCCHSSNPENPQDPHQPCSPQVLQELCQSSNPQDPWGQDLQNPSQPPTTLQTPHQSSSLLNPQASHHSCSLQHPTPSMTDSPSLCCLFPPATLIKLLERVFILSPHITRIPLWSCQLPVTSPSAPAPRWAPELSLSCRGSVCGQLPHVRGARACAWWHFGGLAVSQHRGAPPLSVTSSSSTGTFPSARDESRKQARGIAALHSCVALGIAQSRCY